MKRKKLIITSSILMVIMILLASCGNKTTSQTSTQTEKLALTKENIQKVFKDDYAIVEIPGINTDIPSDQSVSITFVTKNNTNRKDAPKLIKAIQKKLHENFTLGAGNTIQINNYNNKLLARVGSDKDKIVLGSSPVINFSNMPYGGNPSRPITNKNFDLLNPATDIQVTATDDEDGDLTNKIKLLNSIDINKIGTQTLHYEVTDSDGNTRTDDLDIDITK